MRGEMWFTFIAYVFAYEVVRVSLFWGAARLAYTASVTHLALLRQVRKEAAATDGACLPRLRASAEDIPCTAIG
jgi:hypothetical protein